MSPTAAVAEPQRTAVAEGAGDSGVDSLQARLDQLRKD